MPRKLVTREQVVNRPIIENVEVERPISTRAKWDIDEDVMTVVATAETGKARRLHMSEATFLHKIHMAMRHALKGVSLSLHYRKIDDRTLVAWAEKTKDKLKVLAMIVLLAELVTGCAAYNKAMGTDLNDPWWQCAKVHGGPSKTAQVVGAVSPIGGILADPGYSQAVQDCRRGALRPND